MVNPFFVRIIVQAVSSVGKSIWKAYKGVIIDTAKKTAQNARNSDGSKQSNPFTDFINKSLQGANLVPHPLIREDALKILNIVESEDTPLDAETVMRRYYHLFLKNNPLEGGSFYIQAKLYHSKSLLMEEFPGVEEELKQMLDAEFEIYKTSEEKVKEADTKKENEENEKNAKKNKIKDDPPTKTEEEKEK